MMIISLCFITTLPNSVAISTLVALTIVGSVVDYCLKSSSQAGSSNPSGEANGNLSASGGQGSSRQRHGKASNLYDKLSVDYEDENEVNILTHFILEVAFSVCLGEFLLFVCFQTNRRYYYKWTHNVNMTFSGCVRRICQQFNYFISPSSSKCL